MATGWTEQHLCQRRVRYWSGLIYTHQCDSLYLSDHVIVDFCFIYRTLCLAMLHPPGHNVLVQAFCLLIWIMHISFLLASQRSSREDIFVFDCLRQIFLFQMIIMKKKKKPTIVRHHIGAGLVVTPASHLTYILRINTQLLGITACVASMTDPERPQEWWLRAPERPLQRLAAHWWPLQANWSNSTAFLSLHSICCLYLATIIQHEHFVCFFVCFL